MRLRFCRLKLFVAVVIALMMVSTDSIGVTRDRKFRVINAADGLADNSAQTIQCTFTGRLVISTIGHINFYDGSGFSHISSGDYRYKLPKYLGHYHLYFDNKHHLWLKDKNQVTCVDLLTEHFVKDISPIFREEGMRGPVEDMFIDSGGNLWLVQGNYIYSSGKTIKIPVRKGVMLQDINIDDSNVFLFYSDSKVEVFDTKSLKHQYTLTALYGDDVKAFESSSVIYKYGEGFYQIRNGEKGGVLLFLDVNKRQWHELLRTEYYLSNMTDYEDVIYIASAYGYWTYDVKTAQLEHIESITLENGRQLLTDMNCIQFDRQGGMWIGTEKRGLLYSKYIKSPFNVYTWEDQEAIRYSEMMDRTCKYEMLVDGHRLNCTYRDSRGWIWVGSLNGLYYYKPGSKTPIYVKKEEGMVNDVVHSIIEDGKHNMWVSTSNGIVGLRIRNGKVDFVNSFIDSDGIPAEAFVNGRAMRLADGTIVMQALDHVISFNPMKMSIMEDNNVLLHPKFVRLQVNGSNVQAGTVIDGKVVTDKAISRINTINVASTQNSLSLKFSALNYFRPIQTYYRVRVSKVQEEWKVLSFYNSRGLVDSRGQLQLPLLALKPGQYVVEVQASMYPDKWNTPPMRVVINVQEPWWRTTGLSLLLGFILIALIVWNVVMFSGNYRLKMRRNIGELELSRRMSSYLTRAEACRTEMLTPHSDDISGEDIEGNVELEETFVRLMLDMQPLMVQGKDVDHDTLVKLAAKHGMTITQLYDIATHNLFKSPRLLTIAIQIQGAARDLTATDIPVEDIAEIYHFSSPNFFVACFYHHYKMTPYQWREASGNTKDA